MEDNKELSGLLKEYLKALDSYCKVTKVGDEVHIFYDGRACSEVMDKIYDIYGPGWMGIIDNKEIYIKKTLDELIEKTKKASKTICTVEIKSSKTLYLL